MIFKRPAILLLLFILLAGAFNASCPAQDTARVELRKFDTNALEQYKKQGDFVYEQKEAPSSFSFWGWLWSKFIGLLNKIFSPHQQWSFVKVLFYLLMIFALVIIVMNIMGLDIRKIFSRDSKVAIAHQFMEENIKEMDLDELIADAYNKKQWRLCIRYQYLKALRLLTDRQLINWQPGKTNMDYYFELRVLDLKNVFLDVTGSFETAWYGSEDVTQDEFLNARPRFEKFYEQINNYR